MIITIIIIVVMSRKAEQDEDEDDNDDIWGTLETINGYADASVLLAKLVTLNEVIGLPFR